MKRGSARLALVIAATGVIALLLEGVVRIVAPQQIVRIHPDVWVPADGGLGHGLAPNLDTVMNSGERDVRFRTDAWGHRVGEVDPGPADLRILALGDSFLEAMAISYPDTMSERLGRQLGDELEKRVRVVNTGVSGTSPDRYLLVAHRELERRRHDALIVFLFLGNDIVERHVENRPPRAPTARDPLRWPEGFSARDWVDAVVHPLYTWLRERSHLVVLLKQRWLGAAIRLGLTDHAFPAVLMRSEAEAPRWGVTAGICSEIAAEATARGIPALFVLLPPDYVVDTEMGLAFASGSGLEADQMDLDQAGRLLSRHLEASGLRVVDTTAELRAAGPGLDGSVDRHLSPRGHEVVARVVTSALTPLLQDFR